MNPLDPSTAVSIDGYIVSTDGPRPLRTNTTTYTIAFTIKGIDGVLTVSGEVPEVRMWEGDDAPDLRDNALTGKSVRGVLLGGSRRWHFFEPPAFTPCGSSLQSQPMMRDPVTGQLVPVPPTPPSGPASPTNPTPPNPTDPPSGGGEV